jgi:hypothetical protein
MQSPVHQAVTVDVQFLTWMIVYGGIFIAAFWSLVRLFLKAHAQREKQRRQWYAEAKKDSRKLENELRQIGIRKITSHEIIIPDWQKETA